MTGRGSRLLPWLAGMVLAVPMGRGLLRADVYVGNDTDMSNYQVPVRAMAGAVLRSGHFPAWNPFEMAGVVVHAGMQVGLAYPPDLVAAVLPSPKSIEWLLWLHMILLAAGAFRLAQVYLRQPGWLAATAPPNAWLRNLPACVAATVVVGSGPTWGHVFAGHVSLIQAWAWLPWIWAFALEAHASRSAWPSLLATAALAAQVLAGHPQMTYLGLVGLTWLLAVHALTREPSLPGAAATTQQGRWEAVVRAIAVLCVLCVGAAALSALQLWPTWAVQADSGRHFSTPQEVAFAHSAPVRSLVTAFAPLAWGGPVYPIAAFSYHETVAFLGGPALALAWLGAAVGGRRAWLVLVGAFVCVLLSLGDQGPLLPPLIGIVPGLASFRVPARWLLPAVALLALLAAQGCAWLLATLPPKLVQVQRKLRVHPPARVAAAVLGTTALALWAFGASGGGDEGWWAVALRGDVPPGHQLKPALLAELGSGVATGIYLAAATCAVVALACWRPALRRGIGVAVALAAAVSALWFGHLHEDAAFRRPSDTLAWSSEEVAVLRREIDDRHRLITAPPLRQNNWGGAAGIRTAGAYDPVLNAGATRYANLMAGWPVEHYTVNVLAAGPSPWLDRLATSHLLVDGGDQTTNGVFAGWPVVARLGSGRILRRNPTAMDRFAVPGHVAVEPDSRAAVTLLATTPPDTVLLSASLPHDESGHAVLAIVNDTADHVELDVQADGAVVVVVRDTLTEGWTAKVDGRPTPTALADGLFRAAAVPKGDHHLEWTYAPPGLTAGMVVSFCALAAWIIAAVWIHRKKAA